MGEHGSRNLVESLVGGGEDGEGAGPREGSGELASDEGSDKNGEVGDRLGEWTMFLRWLEE